MPFSSRCVQHGFLAEGDWHADEAASQATAVADAASANGPADVEDGAGAADGGECMASAAAAASGLPPKDPLNLSNDEFYAIRSGGLFGSLASRCGPLQHSTPAVELWPPFFPTVNTLLRLRQFHRMPLKRCVYVVVVLV